MTEINGNKLLPETSYRLVIFLGVFDQAGGKSRRSLARSPPVTLWTRT